MRERIQAGLSGPFDVLGQEVFVGASIGIALGNEHAVDPESMLRDADLAMYRAKQAGRGRYEVFDQELHRSALQLLDEVRDRIAVLRPPAYNRFPNSFSHIFAGGYAAGYYSYKWAEVLSADAYGYFEENGILDPKIGGRFREEILAVGGSRPAAESFRAFRGREPRVEALLRHSGMSAA